MPQEQNFELAKWLQAWFPSRKDYMEDGARLLSAVLATHREGGGVLKFAFLGDSPACFGRGSTSQWAETSVGDANYEATVNGGPYISLDGANDYLSIADAAWQEVGSEELFGFAWCWPDIVTGSETIVGKLNAAANLSWDLYRATNQFVFRVTATGDVAGLVSVVTPAGSAVARNWHFLAFYFQSQTLLRIWYALAAESALNIVSVVAGVPGSAFNGNAALAIGVNFTAGAPTAGSHWQGYIGPIMARCNTPAAAVNGYAARLFHLTRQFYLA